MTKKRDGGVGSVGDRLTWQVRIPTRTATGSNAVATDRSRIARPLFTRQQSGSQQAARFHAAGIHS